MNRRTIGKILGALGLVAIISAPFTWLLASGWAAGTKAVIGLLLIGAYFATNFGEFGQFASRRSTFFVGSTVLTIAVVIAGLGAVNYIAAKRNKTWDLTTKKIFSLAPQTTRTLAELKDKVTAYAFVTPKDSSYEQVKLLLSRYTDRAPDKLVVSYVDPKKAPDLALKYHLRDGQTTVVLSRGSGEKESHTAVSGFTGITEQEVTNALIKLNAVGEQKVYFTSGHGEWPLEEAPPDQLSISELRKSLLQEGYEPAALSLAGGTDIPKDAALLVIAGAKSAFTPAEAEKLGKYLDEGGRLLYFAEVGAEPKLDKVLARIGVAVDPGLVADDQYSAGSPYILVSEFFGEGELSEQLRQARYNVQLPFQRGLTVLREGLAEGTQVSPVVLTSPEAYEVKSPTRSPQPEDGGKVGRIPVVVQSVRKLSPAGTRAAEMRAVVFGGSKILLDQLWGDEPNRNMVLNAFGWTTNQVQKVTIRPPDRDVSVIDLDDARVARIRLLSLDLIPLSLLGIGLAVWLNRRSK